MSIVGRIVNFRHMEYFDSIGYNAKYETWDDLSVYVASISPHPFDDSVAVQSVELE